jgi:hypothetical protein
MVVAEKIHCGIEAREWIQSAVPRLSLAFRSRSASRRLSLNYKVIERIGVSEFFRKYCSLGRDDLVVKSLAEIIFVRDKTREFALVEPLRTA